MNLGNFMIRYPPPCQIGGEDLRRDPLGVRKAALASVEEGGMRLLSPSPNLVDFVPQPSAADNQKANGGPKDQPWPPRLPFGKDVCGHEKEQTGREQESGRHARDRFSQHRPVLRDARCLRWKAPILRGPWRHRVTFSCNERGTWLQSQHTAHNSKLGQ